ncbi:hypothetical protein HPB51_009630 [Rhipicephalus microplus]|uniref:Tick transposon n=1 Tax=Rhipicephalus microplus TaxID=6941 RepID=A0A9J6D929_RHIMP|nr:hypothetical protein HPB51_009630 [Rhipicephalus microplus]
MAGSRGCQQSPINMSGATRATMRNLVNVIARSKRWCRFSGSYSTRPIDAALIDSGTTATGLGNAEVSRADGRAAQICSWMTWRMFAGRESVPPRPGTRTPDLAFVLLPEGEKTRWRNTGIKLGSDHHILEIEVSLAHSNGNPGKIKKHKIVDWDKFRKLDPSVITNVEEWSGKPRDATDQTTREVEATEDTSTMDWRLAHLLDARRSLQRRWRRQRHN